MIHLPTTNDFRLRIAKQKIGQQDLVPKLI
jgi:hypothetical protein